MNSLHGVYPLKGFILDESAVRSFMLAVMECSEIAFFNFLSVYWLKVAGHICEKDVDKFWTTLGEPLLYLAGYSQQVTDILHFCFYIGSSVFCSSSSPCCLEPIGVWDFLQGKMHDRENPSKLWQHRGLWQFCVFLIFWPAEFRCRRTLDTGIMMFDQL